MDQRLRIMPGDEEDMEAAVDNALNALDQTPAPEQEQPTTVRTLVKRSRESFAKNFEQLQTQIHAVDQSIQRSLQNRDAVIAEAEARHRAFEREAEKDLFQIKTVKAAIELAMAVMPDE
jgi:hypothetical protein